MKKAIAILLSLFALAYVGLAYANESEDSSQGEQKESRETSKREWEQKREIVKAEWEQKREAWKTEREDAIEKWKLEKEKFRSEFKAKFTAERCAKIEEKIQNRTSKFGSSKVKHMSVYNNLLARLDKFIKRFEDFNATSAADVDAAKITKLKNDRVQLVVLINDFKTSYEEYSSKLASAKKFTCGSSEGEFRGSLVDARTYLKTVHGNAAAIRTYVRETILPDLLVVKKDIAKIKGETEDENKTEDENDEGDENDSSDTTLPTVSITSPADGTSYAAATTVDIVASASDNKEIDKVAFYDGDVLKETDEDAPYAFSWVISASEPSATHSWTAKAYDDAENTVVSSIVNLTVAIPTLTP